MNNRRILKVLTATGTATNRKYVLGVFNTFHSAKDKYSVAACIKKLTGSDIVETKAYRDCVENLTAFKDCEFAGFRYVFEEVESFL